MNDFLIKRWEPILKCPLTNKSISLNEIEKKLIVKNNNIEVVLI